MTQENKLQTQIYQTALEICKKNHPEGDWAEQKPEQFWLSFSEEYRSDLLIQAIQKLGPEVHSEDGANTKLRIHGVETNIHAITQGLAKHERIEFITYVQREADQTDYGHRVWEEEIAEFVETLDEDKLGPAEEDDYKQILEGDIFSILEAEVLSIEFNAHFSAQNFYRHERDPDTGNHESTFNIAEHIKSIELLLCTGGPECRILLDTQEENGVIQVRDWGTRYANVALLSKEAYDLLYLWSHPEC